jgi:hypothetical protein
MQQEFITSRGKAIIENNVLFVRNFKPDFFDTVFGRIIFPLILALAIILQFVYIRGALDYYIAGFWTIFFLVTYANRLYDLIVKRSFANRISLSRFKSIEIKPDQWGLETEIRIHLRNGRYRPINFRILEKQYELFTELISRYTAQPQFA